VPASGREQTFSLIGKHYEFSYSWSSYRHCYHCYCRRCIYKATKRQEKGLNYTSLLLNKVFDFSEILNQRGQSNLIIAENKSRASIICGQSHQVPVKNSIFLATLSV